MRCMSASRGAAPPALTASFPSSIPVTHRRSGRPVPMRNVFQAYRQPRRRLHDDHPNHSRHCAAASEGPQVDQVKPSRHAAGRPVPRPWRQDSPPNSGRTDSKAEEADGRPHQCGILQVHRGLATVHPAALPHQRLPPRSHAPLQRMPVSACVSEAGGCTGVRFVLHHGCADTAPSRRGAFALKTHQVHPAVVAAGSGSRRVR